MQVGKKPLNFLQSLSFIKMKSMTANLQAEKQLVNTS